MLEEMDRGWFERRRLSFELWRLVLQQRWDCHATGCAVLRLVRLNGATRIHSLKRKDQAGHVEYWKAQCGESRMLRLGGGKERKLLPIRTVAISSLDWQYALLRWRRHGWPAI